MALEASDEEDIDVVHPYNGSSESRLYFEDDDDGILDAMEEEEELSARRNGSARKKVTKEKKKEGDRLPERDDEDDDEDEDGVQESLGQRPIAGRPFHDHAPSVLQEEREAREIGDTGDGGSETIADDDVILDEKAYNDARPIVCEAGKSKARYRAPFAACVHFPFKTELGEAIEPYKMTVEKYSEANMAKNIETTKEIILSMTHAKLAQQVVVFRIFANSSKAQSSQNSPRRYAAFVRVAITDFDDDTTPKDLPSDGLLLYPTQPIGV